jgi:glutaredoxin
MSATDFLKGHDLAVYSENWCPDCTRFKRWADSSGVTTREILISEHPEAAEKLENETGKMAVPFLLVDGKTWVRGYHKELPGRFSETKLLDELRTAITTGAHAIG